MSRGQPTRNADRFVGRNRVEITRIAARGAPSGRHAPFIPRARTTSGSRSGAPARRARSSRRSRHGSRTSRRSALVEELPASRARATPYAVAAMPDPALTRRTPSALQLRDRREPRHHQHVQRQRDLARRSRGSRRGVGDARHEEAVAAGVAVAAAARERLADRALGRDEARAGRRRCARSRTGRRRRARPRCFAASIFAHSRSGESAPSSRLMPTAPASSTRRDRLADRARIARVAALDVGAERHRDARARSPRPRRRARAAAARRRRDSRATTRARRSSSRSRAAPRASIRRALPASHAFGRRSSRPGACSSRNVLAWVVDAARHAASPRVGAGAPCGDRAPALHRCCAA